MQCFKTIAFIRIEIKTVPDTKEDVLLIKTLTLNHDNPS